MLNHGSRIFTDGRGSASHASAPGLDRMLHGDSLLRGRCESVCLYKKNTGMDALLRLVFDNFFLLIAFAFRRSDGTPGKVTLRLRNTAGFIHALRNQNRG